jgi:DNA-binding NarL/FixJ family response regulator
MIVGGASLTEIGEKMLVSVKTVSTYRSRLLTKLGLSSNAELVRYALQHGILR